jgi:DNA invertase Pin-like site-specific DNA recombinase
MKQTNTLAIAYTRVSTDEQAESGLSLDVQEKSCLEALEREGFKLHKEIRDEGKSGGSMAKRPDMKEIIRMGVGGRV